MKLRLIFLSMFLVFYLTSLIIAGHSIGKVSELLFFGSLSS